jgi:DNA-binding NarL/FixJ family response regulator
MSDGLGSPARLRLVVVDDHAVLREGLAAILDAEDDIEVVGQGGSAEDALRLVQNHRPDIILLDIDMPGGGLEASRRISNEFPETRIVILTASQDDDHLMSALSSGARAYVLKGVGARDLLRIVRAVASGESYVPPALAAGLLMGMQGGKVALGKSTADPLAELTHRERDILDHLAVGLSNKEIGQKLFLSEKTVKHHITNILQKLQVRNRVEAALLAQRSAKPEKR